MKCEVGYLCDLKTEGSSLVCIKNFSVETGKSTMNSISCKTGFQNAKGVCTEVSGVRHNGKMLEAPYKCDLNVSTTCRVESKDGQLIELLNCQCSLQNNDEAFCPFPGVENYATVQQNLKKAIESSSDCHINIVINPERYSEWYNCISD